MSKTYLKDNHIDFDKNANIQVTTATDEGVLASYGVKNHLKN